MNFCKDCRFIITLTDGGLSRCSHPKAETPNSSHFVTGTGNPVVFFYCSVMRGVESTGCGAQGKLFEPKEKADKARIAADALKGEKRDEDRLAEYPSGTDEEGCGDA